MFMIMIMNHESESCECESVSAITSSLTINNRIDKYNVGNNDNVAVYGLRLWFMISGPEARSCSHPSQEAERRGEGGTKWRMEASDLHGEINVCAIAIAKTREEGRSALCASALAKNKVHRRHILEIFGQSHTI